MAFWLYSKNDDNYLQVCSVKLTGKEGLLAAFLQAKAGEDTPFAWQLNGPEIIKMLDPELDADSHELVIDMMPEALSEVCLYRVTSLRGVSEFDESDMVMACRILQQGRTNVPAAVYKADFRVTTVTNTRQIVEAFHLTGGVATGNYYWSKPKMDIGAAICPSEAK